MSGPQQVKTPGRPWHLWLIGIVGGLWSVMGVVSFTLTQMNVEAAMSRFPPEQRAYFESFPWWAVAFWAVGVLGGVIGCLLLLLRNRLAFHAFLASATGAIVTSLGGLLLLGGMEVMGGTDALGFTLLPVIVAALLAYYARAMSRKGVLASLAAVLLAGTAVSAHQERTLDPAAGLEEFVHAERRAHQLPGLAAVVVRSDGPPRVYVSGERRIGKGDPITTADRMHIGSLTKSITATLIGALAEKGPMTLDTTIGEAFPELSPKMHQAYRQVTVRQLLRHSAGIGTYGTNVSLLPMLGLKGTPTEQRYEFVQRVLAEPPRFDPGSRFEYSNAGAAIVGAMAERLAGSPYRALVERLVFAPIDARVAFGNPGLAAEPQPWGHRTILGTVAEVPPAAPLYTTPLAIEPSGDASPSLSDIGRFLQLHLRGLRGQDDGLKARTIQELQGRSPDGSPRGGAVGWNVMPRDGVESNEHFGSSGAYVAYATIQPSRDVAVGVFTNLGGDQALRNAIAGIALRIAARYSGDPTR